MGKKGREFDLQVEYEDSKVKELFEDLNDVQNSKNLMKRKIGLEMTRVVKKKYNQIIAFTSFYAILESRIGKIESLVGDRNGEYSLRLTASYRLIVSPKSIDRSPEELKKCDTIVVKGVIDYHGKGAKNNWIIP